MKNLKKTTMWKPVVDIVRLVAKAQGGLAKLARKASVSRQALHEALSPKGNPRIRTFKTCSAAWDCACRSTRSRNKTPTHGEVLRKGEETPMGGASIPTALPKLSFSRP